MKFMGESSVVTIVTMGRKEISAYLLSYIQRSKRKILSILCIILFEIVALSLLEVQWRF